MQASVRLSSSAGSRRVIEGVSSSITRTCYRNCRWKAYSAPLSAREPPKGQKRVSKQERRTRIEAFVEKYRASNDGKFPKVCTIQQSVGGSYYTVREIFQELEYKHKNLPWDKSKAAQLQETAECAEHSRHEDSGSDSFNTPNFNAKHDVDDAILSQNVSATVTTIIEKTEAPISSGPEDKKLHLYHVEKMQYESDPTVSNQTESDNMMKENVVDSLESGKSNVSEDSLPMQTEVPRVESQSDPGSHQVEPIVTSVHMKSMEKIMHSGEPAVSDQTESEKVVKANAVDRERKTEEHKGSTKTSLLGSLKSFAYRISNFWKRL